jgi:hypothetical protein
VQELIHTATMVDAVAVVFVRGKRPGPELVAAAEKIGLPLLGTRFIMFSSCGRLFQAGLKGCSELRVGDEPPGVPDGGE